MTDVKDLVFVLLEKGFIESRKGELNITPFLLWFFYKESIEELKELLENRNSIAVDEIREFDFSYSEIEEVYF